MTTVGRACRLSVCFFIRYFILDLILYSMSLPGIGEWCKVKGAASLLFLIVGGAHWCVVVAASRMNEMYAVYWLCAGLPVNQPAGTQDCRDEGDHHLCGDEGPDSRLS